MVPHLPAQRPRQGRAGFARFRIAQGEGGNSVDDHSCRVEVDVTGAGSEECRRGGVFQLGRQFCSGAGLAVGTIDVISIATRITNRQSIAAMAVSSTNSSTIATLGRCHSIRQRNFRGRGQTIGLSVNYSRFSRSANIRTEEMVSSVVLKSGTSMSTPLIAGTMITRMDASSWYRDKPEALRARHQCGEPAGMIDVGNCGHLVDIDKDP